ncbi:MAG TPA: tetratricopeptide repeat protein, partial [Pyrinomonadaceae bacterium]|nr:tetratricopeptide repeat protein [Pyrinomonadaceae bacterium]
TALKLDPRNVGALSESAALALSENDPALATMYLERLEAIAPASAGVKILRARVFFANGRVTEAIGQLDEMTASPEAEQLRKDILSSTSVDASELVKQLANEPKNTIVLGKLCSLLRVKEPLKALEYCRQAVSADPSRIENAIGFGAALIQAKRFDDAIAVFRKLVPMAPDNSTVRTNLATALFFAKRYAEAKTEFRWLTESQPNLAVAYYFLAIAHDHLGEYVDAMANYQQFLRLADPKSTLEIEKVNLRLPGLQKQIRDGKGKKSY